MQYEKDYADLLSSFNEHGVKYLVVGAYAVGYHSMPRATSDFDVWVEASIENAPRVFKALAHFGAPLENLTIDELAKHDLIFQIGVPPLRIDIITEIDGVDFETAWNERETGRVLGIAAFIIGRKSLIANKRAAARDKDLVDLRRLETKHDASPGT